MAHKAFAKVGKWKAVPFADAKIDFGQAGELGMFDEIFGRTPDEVFVLTKIKQKDLTIECIGDQAGVYVIDSDVTVSGTLSYNQVDGGSALYITGKLTCANLALGSESNLWVGKDLTVKKIMISGLADAGSLIVGGKTTVDTWLEEYGRASFEFGKKAAIKTFVRWDDEELDGFPNVTPAEVAMADAFVEEASYESMTKALGKGKPLLASAAVRKSREKAAKQAAKQKDAAPASAELDLSDEDLKALPATLFKKPLTKLVIGGYSLTKLPAELGKIATLQVLGITASPVKALPASLGDLPALRRLEITGAPDLTDLPASLVKRNALTELSWGPLDACPSVVGKLTNLEKLHLWGMSSNRMSEFPIEITKLAALRSLTLHSHAFTTIPDEILALQNLEELDLWASLGAVSKVPDLSKLPNLRVLLFSGASSGSPNDRDASPELLEAIHDLPSVEYLRLANWKRWKPLVACLERVATFPKLRSLDLSWSAVGGLPAALLAMPSLERIEYRGVPGLEQQRYARDYPRIQFKFD